MYRTASTTFTASSSVHRQRTATGASVASERYLKRIGPETKQSDCAAAATVSAGNGLQQQAGCTSCPHQQATNRYRRFYTSPWSTTTRSNVFKAQLECHYGF
jgi:hypothetical protein